MQYLWIEIPTLRSVISGSYNSYLAMRPAAFPPTMKRNVRKEPPLENSSRAPEHALMIPEHRTTTSEWAELVVGEKKGGEGMLRKESLAPDTTGSPRNRKLQPRKIRGTAHILAG